MRIINIVQENFSGATNCRDVTVTLTGFSEEIDFKKLAGAEVDLVPKGQIIKSVSLNGVTYPCNENVANSLTELFGIWPNKKKKESLDPDKLFVKKVYYDKEKGVTVVIFEDGVKITKKLSEGDIFDVRTAVALAIAERLYGSRTKFAKTVDKIAVDQVAKSKKKAEKKVDAE